MSSTEKAFGTIGGRDRRATMLQCGTFRSERLQGMVCPRMWNHVGHLDGGRWRVRLGVWSEEGPT